MKSRTLKAWAVACACTWAATAGAGGSPRAQGDRASSTRVETPVSVSESAPSWGGNPDTHESPSSFVALPGNRDSTERGTGASSGTGGSGSVGSDALATSETTEYWLIGSEDAKPNVGASASDGAGGSVSFESSPAPDG